MTAFLCSFMWMAVLNANNCFYVIVLNRSRTLSVAYDPEEDSYHVLTDPLDNTATARATYHTNVNGNGWNYFEAKALPASTSYADYFNSLRAMGYLEGYTSWKQIVDFYPNYYQSKLFYCELCSFST